MLNQILQMLKDANGETENIRIAQGVNKLPTTLNDGVQTLKAQAKFDSTTHVDWDAAEHAKACRKFFQNAANPQAILSLLAALREQVRAANHDFDCAYFRWDWEHSWHYTDCTCKPSQAEATLKAMKPYLRHNTEQIHCDYMKHSDNPCTCGLDAILKQS